MPKTATRKKSLKAPKASDLPLKTKPREKLPGVWNLSKSGCALLWDQKQLFALILLVFGILDLALAQGFTGGLSVTSAKSQLSTLFHGHFSNVGSGLTIYALMLASIGSSSSGSGGGFGYSLILSVIASLALIWALRNSSNKVKVRLRDAYYRGMYPLIPFLAILLLIGIELIPMIAGISLYTIAINNAIAVTALEKLLFLILMLGLSSLSVFLLSSSVFALYIVTLPEMTPIKALRSAKELVKKRRWEVILRLLYLPLALLVISSAVMLPFIIFLPAAAPWLLLVLTLVILAVFHAYMYNFYRELIK